MKKRCAKSFGARSAGAKLLAALSTLLLLCGPAAADIVYTTSDWQSSTGELGLIVGDTANTVSSALVGDSRVFSFLDGDNSRVAVREYTYSDSGQLADRVFILDPETTWLDPPIENPSWEKGSLKASNTYSMAVFENYLYAACYDSGNVVEISMSDYKPTGRSFTYPSENLSGNLSARGIQVLASGDSIYALFILDAGDFVTHSEGKLVKLDRELQLLGEISVGKNPKGMAVWGGKIAVAYLGGPYEAVSSGGIDLVDFDLTSKTSLVTSASSKAVEAISRDGADTLYFIEITMTGTASNFSGSISESTLYKLPEGGSVQKIAELSTGYTFNHLTYDSENGNIVVGSGGKVYLFDGDWAQKKEVSVPNLSSLAVVAKATPPEPPESAVGCDAGLTAFGVLLVLPLALRKKSR
jgi:Synergist-CTERM protein sorting domain-containing protein